MATQTQRTISEVLANLPDNTSGQIAPEDVRDIVATLLSGFAEERLTSSVETSIGTVNTYVKLAGTTLLDKNSTYWSSPQSNRLQYSGPAKRGVNCQATLSITTASNNKTIKVAVAKNGVVIEDSAIRRFVATGSDEGAVALFAFDEVINGDYFEVWVANETDSTNITATSLNFAVIDFPADLP